MKPAKFNESVSWIDAIKMQTEFALLESMTKSKTLTIMVLLMLCGFGGFIYFLLKMAESQV